MRTTLQDYIKKFGELKTVFDALPDGIVAILDSGMNIASANLAISSLLELPIEQIVGKNSSELFKNTIPELIEVIEQTIKMGKEIRNYTIESVNKNGTLRSILVSTTVIKEIKTSDPGIVLILHDVSEITKLRKIALQLKRYGEIIGNSEKMKNIYALIESIKNYNTSILIVGETGTGKELFARAIHDSSSRKNKPFVPVNCSALPANLIESELFGHVKGAFTGAIYNRPGRFQLAHEGTIFLDEIGTLPIDLQAKLLRTLQEKVVEPLGSNKRINVDVRILAATNRDLSDLVEHDEFREDLYYRLKVMQLNIPPLRDRSDDIALLIDHFIDRLNRYYNKNIIGVSPSALEIFNKYLWPGNVRELENAIEHSFVLTRGALIESHSLPPEIRHIDK
ncbi:MAG: sigma 54-interacting transcriptional regulator, partial [Ignavibacteriaceae bacterium]|nr:sigma 54-interacting transcriptional regulator [Ignavibacteriaceae bacterium]